MISQPMTYLEAMEKLDQIYSDYIACLPFVNDTVIPFPTRKRYLEKSEDLLQQMNSITGREPLHIVKNMLDYHWQFHEKLRRHVM